MTRQAIVVTFALLAVFASACASTAGTTHQAKTSAAAQTSSTTTAAASTTSVAVPDPQGRVGGSCDLLLNSDFGSNVSGWLVATVQVHNTGNIGIKTRAKAVWQQAGSAPIVKVKPLRVKVGRQKAAHFKIPIDENGVSAFQAAPGYLSGKTPCSFTATIMSTFGTAR
jgi:maltose-binding protein MalE